MSFPIDANMKIKNFFLKQAGVSEKSLRRRLVDGVFWLTVVKLFGQVISWTIAIYVIRILSPNDYGLMAMASVYVGFIVLFNEVGLGAAIIQKKDLKQEDLSTIWWVVLSINLALYALSLLSAPIVAAFYNEPRVAGVIRVASIVFIIRSLGLVSNNMLTREMKFNRQSQAALIGNTSGAMATLWLATEGFGVWSLVYGNIIIEIVTNLLVILFYPWKLEFSFSFSKVKNMIDFGFQVAVARLFWYLSANMDLLIAGKILGKTQLGYYAVAVQLAMIPLDKIIGSTISHVALPTFSEVQDNPALLRRYYLKIVNLVAFVSFPVCWGIFLVAESAVPLFLSDKWLPAILPLQILSMVTAFRAIHIVNAPLEMAVGRPAITIRNFVIITSILALSFLIGSSYGLEGLAYSWLAYPVVFLITTSITIKLIGLTLAAYFKELRHPFLGTGFMVLAVLLGQKLVLIDHGLVAQAAGSAVLGLASYLLYYVLCNREMFVEARKLLRR
jgi:O-antigen/teichoic acid export membrane protein